MTRHSRLFLALTLLIAVFSLACSSALSYKKVSGVQDVWYQQEQPDVYRLTYNGSQPGNVAGGSVVYAAAKLAVEAGYRYFTLTGTDSERGSKSAAVPTPAPMPNIEPKAAIRTEHYGEKGTPVAAAGSSGSGGDTSTEYGHTERGSARTKAGPPGVNMNPGASFSLTVTMYKEEPKVPQGSLWDAEAIIRTTPISRVRVPNL